MRLLPSSRLRAVIGMASIACLVAACSPEPVPAAKPSPTPGGLADDMATGGPSAGPRAAADPEALSSFTDDLTRSGPVREVFARHLPALGARAILDVLEQRDPACHGEAHELGRALMALRKDIGAALRECGAGCTSACMHGAVGEAFGGSDIPTIKSKMKDFCSSSPMRELHPAGNCAHGIGHALMFAAHRDLEDALQGCHGFDQPGMQYYCATGVYMELLQGPSPPPFVPGSHEPCSTHPEFAAACYRYRARSLVSEAGGFDAFRASCLALQPPLRSACFHGLGSALVRPAMSDPGLLGRYCSTEREEDRTLCVEGAMEKQADFSREAARAVCARQTGEVKRICDASVETGMYAIDKPSIAFYVAAKRK